jgi:two-component system phosphate regulon response regulator PhoB
VPNECILIVEDEEDIRELLRYNLAKEGYRLLMAGTAGDAWKIAQRDPPDLVLLDLMLPDVDGLDLCRRLKGDGETARIPVIMLTARGEEADVVVGLEMGADDYMSKPFSPRVLLARIRAVLRRKTEPDDGEPETLRAGRVTIHCGRHEVLVDGRPVVLTATEFRVLCILVRRPGWVFTRHQIACAVHGEDVVADRSVDVQIVGLRKKLGAAQACLETVRGVGYRFNEGPELA